MLSPSKRLRDSVASLGPPVKLSRYALLLTFAWEVYAVALPHWRCASLLCTFCMHRCLMPLLCQAWTFRADDTSSAANGLIAAVRSQTAAAAAERGSQQPAAASLSACGQQVAVLVQEDLQPATLSLSACVQQPADVHVQPAAARLDTGVQPPTGAYSQPAALSLNACVRHLPRKWDQQRLEALLQEQGLEYAVVR